MTNPRKFADKLEIIRRKEEEANAAFDKIMQEVSDARMGISPPLTTISSHYTQGHMMRSPNADVRLIYIFENVDKNVKDKIL